MKIIDIRVRGGRHSSLTFVQVETDEGLTGIGVTGSPSWIIEPIVLDRQGGLIRFLAGRDPLEPGRLWLRMFQDWQALRGRGGEGGMAVNAMGAVDMALWDLAGKALNQPLCKLLGGAVQSRVMAYASGTAFDPDSLEGKGPAPAEAPRTVGGGKPGNGPARGSGPSSSAGATISGPRTKRDWPPSARPSGRRPA